MEVACAYVFEVYNPDFETKEFCGQKFKHEKCFRNTTCLKATVYTKQAFHFDRREEK